MKLYIAATADKYELPIIVADSAAELARLCGCHRDIIHGEIYRRAHRKPRQYYQKTKKYSFHVVEVPDDD